MPIGWDGKASPRNGVSPYLACHGYKLLQSPRNEPQSIPSVPLYICSQNELTLFVICFLSELNVFWFSFFKLFDVMSTFHEYTMVLFRGQVVGSCPVLKPKAQIGISLPALWAYCKASYFCYAHRHHWADRLLLSEGNNECRVSCLAKGLRISDWWALSPMQDIYISTTTHLRPREHCRTGCRKGLWVTESMERSTMKFCHSGIMCSTATPPWMQLVSSDITLAVETMNIQDWIP